MRSEKLRAVSVDVAFRLLIKSECTRGPVPLPHLLCAVPKSDAARERINLALESDHLRRVFSRLNEHQLTMLVNAMDEQKYKAGDYVMRQGCAVRLGRSKGPPCCVSPILASSDSRLIPARRMLQGERGPLFHHRLRPTRGECQ